MDTKELRAKAEVKIKPLTWQGDGATWYAESILGLYAAWNGYYRPPGERGGVNAGSTVNEAKAAAQADFEARIRSAILPDVSGAEAASERPFLRDCPFCHTAGSNDELIAFMSLTDVVHQFDYGFTIRCCQCGSEVHDEYKDEVVRLWNGTKGEEPADA